MELQNDSEMRGWRWILEKADWEKFRENSDEWLSSVEVSMSAEELM